MADRVCSGVLEAAVRTGWSPVTKVAEAAVVKLLQNIRVGQLRIVTNRQTYTLPAEDAEHDEAGVKAEIRVVNDSFWVRLCTMSDLGFAEAFMYGDVQCDDLISLFQIFLINKDNLSNLNSRFSYLMSLPQKLTSYRFLNTIGNSRSNISAHYDISNDMFAGFLSEDMTYSCGIFKDLDSDLRRKSTSAHEWTSGQSLESLLEPRKTLPLSPPLSQPETPAESGQIPLNGITLFQQNEGPEDELKTSQTRKLQHIIKKAGIRDGNRVLEIGSGWGSMAMTIAQQYPNVTVDTLTLSVQQQSLAQDRIRALGPDIANRITVHLVDYRAMPAEWEGVFDRVISVEMIENVGHEFLERYWSVVDWAMKKKGGVGVVQVITIPEARFEKYMHEIDFIRKWIFPGGLLPSLTFLLQTLQSGSKGRLVVDSISNIGPHYARTLREWRRRFEAKFESVIVPALRREYPDVMGVKCDPIKAREEVEVFRRKWIYYYCYCEIGFTTRTLGDHIITFVREGYQDYGCDVYD